MIISVRDAEKGEMPMITCAAWISSQSGSIAAGMAATLLLGSPCQKCFHDPSLLVEAQLLGHWLWPPLPLAYSVQVIAQPDQALAQMHFWIE